MGIYSKPKKTRGWQCWNAPLTGDSCATSGGGGGGATIIEIFYSDLVTAMNAGTLTPGATYKILLFNQNMLSGSPTNPYGYLPQILYDDGSNAGITIYMQAISTTEMATSGYGEFYNPNYTDGNSYYNTDGTGLYRIWDGDNPDPLQVPAYQVSDVVYWEVMLGLMYQVW